MIKKWIDFLIKEFFELAVKIKLKDFNAKIRTVRKMPDGKHVVSLEPLPIYSKNKPEIIDFVSDSDYRVLLNFYGMHFYGSKKKEHKLNNILHPYPYTKYDWDILLQIIWKNQNFHKKIQEFKKADIKKLEINCYENCKCCENLKNKNIEIKNIPEFPRKECPLEDNICKGVSFTPIIDFD